MMVLCIETVIYIVTGGNKMGTLRRKVVRDRRKKPLPTAWQIRQEQARRRREAKKKRKK